MSDSLLGKLAYDALGSSAKLIGEELVLPSTKWAVANVKRVLKKAAQRKTALGIEGGAVPPRVLPALIGSACVCEDQVVASYLGGVLCSSRTRISRDDRAVAMVKVIDGLSSYALRAHCIVYASVLRQRDHKLSDVRRWLIRGNGVTVILNDEEVCDRMEFQRTENAEAILEHAFVNLSANDLTMQGIRLAPASLPKERLRYVHLTLRGVELFCWGNGVGQLGVDAYFSNTLESPEAEALGLIPRKLELGIVSPG